VASRVEDWVCQEVRKKWEFVTTLFPRPKFQSVPRRSHLRPNTLSCFMASKDSQDSSSTSQDPTAYLRSAQFSRDSSSVSLDNAVTANDLLLGAYDPAKLHPLAQLSDQLDYLVLDDDKVNELPGPEQPFLLEAGVMTCATELGLCTSVVSLTSPRLLDTSLPRVLYVLTPVLFSTSHPSHLI
jgi:hypothetical protein